jgi:sigma-B regulation protein RsbU (phosphoserine phosphatase)
MDPLRLRVTPPVGDAFEHVCTTDSLVVGRSSRADLVLSDRFLSRQHARFYREGDAWMVEDLGSRNTTLLNGRPVTSPARVGSGDLVKLSETLIAIGGEGGAAPAPPSEEKTSSSDTIVLRSASELLAAAERESAGRLKLLNDVHRALAATQNLQDLLEVVLDRAFAQLGPEEAVVYLKSPHGGLEPVAKRRLPGAKGELTHSRSLEHEVVEKAQAALVLDALTDERFAAAQSILSSGVRSLIAAPLLDATGSLGMIVLSSRIHLRRFSEQDMELLVAFASVAALRIRNLALAEEAARRRELEKELTIARGIQLALLPEHLPDIPGYAVFATNDASRAVSGDFYEFQQRDGSDEQIIVIADVSGKGIGASLLAASFDALLMGPIEVNYPPDVICSKVSRRLFAKTPPERYVTAFLLALDPGSGRVSYTNAGHNAGLLVRANGSVQRLEATGMPIGLMPFAEYEKAEVTLEPGDLIVLYTDGLTEAANAAGDEFGLDRLEAVVRRHAAEPLVALAVAIETAIEVFVDGTPFGDDRTLVVLRREPKDTPSA